MQTSEQRIDLHHRWTGATSQLFRFGNCRRLRLRRVRIHAPSAQRRIYLTLDRISVDPGLGVPSHLDHPRGVARVISKGIVDRLMQRRVLTMCAARHIATRNRIKGSSAVCRHCTFRTHLPPTLGVFQHYRHEAAEQGRPPLAHFGLRLALTHPRPAHAPAQATLA